MPDLIRHPESHWTPAFAGVTNMNAWLVIYNCRSNKCKARKLGGPDGWHGQLPPPEPALKEKIDDSGLELFRVRENP